tara:strand:- start:285 stop:1496 length:1212 start_codon:yes stop_codon:yes gene_type:complete
MIDHSFKPSHSDLLLGIAAVEKVTHQSPSPGLPKKFPPNGLGERKTIEVLGPIALGKATQLGAPLAFAHMDPPTPWITWITTLWNASLNQNLLHPDVSPVARDFEKLAIDWLCPYFGMDGGHMTPGSTLSNLTALWVARDLANINTVVASDAAHISIQKSARILGLKFQPVKTDENGSLDKSALPRRLSNCCLVLTAGTTSSGAIDSLDLTKKASWTHVDGAWAGPLRISAKYRYLLDGIQNADSVSVSGHKWFFQPKESGILFFKDSEKAHKTISSSAEYLTADNVGLLGSRGAIGLPLLATLISWGINGLSERLEKCMILAEGLYNFLSTADVFLYAPPITGVVLWRPRDGSSTRTVFKRLPSGSASLTNLNGCQWIRHVAANPQLDKSTLISEIKESLRN